MGSTTFFKRVFEVQIFHDYFLTTGDGLSFFGRNQAKKNDLLLKKLIQTGYNVQNLFALEPISTTKLTMEQYRLIMKKTPLGFVVGTEVSMETQAGETLYRPHIPYGNDLSLTFSIRPLVSYFNSIGNLSLRPPLPSIYYFTNTDKAEFDEVAVPPFTSLPLPNRLRGHQNGMKHEMGAMIDFGGTAREALQRTDGNDPAHWEDIDDRRFVSDADRTLLPDNFNYPLRKEAGVTQLNFVLEDGTGTVIKTISKSGTTALEDVSLNFSKVDETDPGSESIAAGFYTLKVTENAGPEIQYPIYLNKQIYSNVYHGVVDIRSDEPDAPLGLLDANGFLKTRINAANEKIPHPIFEIRYKNRRTYWRYNKEVDFSAAEIAATAAHLEHDPTMLVSLRPKGLTETLVPFFNGVSLLLPNPRNPSIKVEGERIFSEIFINPSNKLLN